MPNNKKKKDPKWFKQQVSENDKGLFKRALANFIASEYDEKQQMPTANVDTYIAVLPYTAKLIPKWVKVTQDNFSTHNQEAHRTYQSTLRNMLNSK